MNNFPLDLAFILTAVKDDEQTDPLLAKAEATPNETTNAMSNEAANETAKATETPNEKVRPITSATRIQRFSSIPPPPSRRAA